MMYEMENMLCWNKKKAMEELEQGRELTNQLRDLLTKSSNSISMGLGEEEDLVMKIFNSFAKSISMLTIMTSTATATDFEEDHEAVSQINPRNNNISWDDLGISTQIKDPRGRNYKRRYTLPIIIFKKKYIGPNISQFEYQVIIILTRCRMIYL